MSKAKFTYDESGATFFYFVLSFLALILVPTTYHLWPNESQNDSSKALCGCPGCKIKRQQQEELIKSKRSKRNLLRALIVIAWCVFALIAYRCATTQNEYVNWDPFEILGVQEGASANDIKKAYRKLSLIYHPDKGSDNPDKFVEITKAYAALTDEEARKNWEQYGNPDGPTFASYGIALPSWIVEKENSFVVLGIYALIFMVALPVSVGAWWHKSMQFGNDQILMDTSKTYYNYIHLTPNMALKRVIQIIAASLEFAKAYNPEIIERPTDNQEVPRLIRDIPLTIEKNVEQVLSYTYSVKARALLYAHLGRIKLPPTTLDVDRCYIVKKCPYLIQEFVQCTAQLITLALSGRVSNMPTLFTLENAMKLGSMVVQALWDYQSPLLQLPHFNDNALKQMTRKKIKIQTIEQLARMKEKDRRDALKHFTDSQYEDIRYVLGRMPMIQVECNFEVLDDEDPNVITAFSIVTAIVKLKRLPMRELFDKNESTSQGNDANTVDSDAGQLEERRQNSQAGGDTIVESDNTNNNDTNLNDENQCPSEDGNLKKRNKSNKSCGDASKKIDSSAKQDLSSEDDEEIWDKKFHEKVIKKQKVFESKPKKSHSVHCPYFPDDKQEFWWVYIVDRKRVALVTAPLLVTNLVDKEEVELKFSAPKTGVYSYTIVVRSDSYVNCSVYKQATIDVKPAKEYVEPDYDISEDEVEEDAEDEHSSIEDSDLLTDTDED